MARSSRARPRAPGLARASPLSKPDMSSAPRACPSVSYVNMSDDFD